MIFHAEVQVLSSLALCAAVDSGQAKGRKKVLASITHISTREFPFYKVQCVNSVYEKGRLNICHLSTCLDERTATETHGGSVIHQSCEAFLFGIASLIFLLRGSLHLASWTHAPSDQFPDAPYIRDW